MSEDNLHGFNFSHIPFTYSSLQILTDNRSVYKILLNMKNTDWVKIQVRNCTKYYFLGEIYLSDHGLFFESS